MRTQSSKGDQWTVQIVKFFWEKFFALWKLRNKKVHGTDEKTTYKLKAEQYRTTIETMFHLCNRLEAAYWQYMFQLIAEIEEFLKTKSFAYIKTYLEIWYPFFKRGIKNSQQNAIRSMRPMTSYFSQKTAISKSKLPPRFTFRYDGLKWDATRKKSKGKRYKTRTLYEYFSRK